MHKCPKNGCGRRVRSDMLACRPHWYQVTPATRNRVWRAWNAGDEDEHRAAMAAAIEEMNAR